MPIYEFQCQTCNHVDELLMRFSDPEPAGCSVCGAPVKKLISQSTFALKGSGWYVTDYARKGASTTESTTPKPLSSSSETSTAPAASEASTPAAAAPAATTPTAT